MSDFSRYFLAIIPPVPISERVMEIKTFFRDQYNCKAPLRSPAHITLHMPFLFKTVKEVELQTKLKEVALSCPGFKIRLNGFGAFEPRTIFIEVEKNEALMSFQRDLSAFNRRQLGLFNTNYKDYGYHPHMTVAFRDLKKSLFPQAWSEFRECEFEASFEVSSFWLLKHNGKVWQAHTECPFYVPPKASLL